MSGRPRACRPEELGELVRLANQVFRPRGGEMDAEYPLVFSPRNGEHLRVIDVAGRLVSHVGLCIRDAFIGGVALRVASVGGVCTAPDQRGQGFASALMADAADHARACGAQLMLISGGRGLYHRLGYVTVGRFRRVTLSAENLPVPAGAAQQPPRLYDLAPLQPGDLDAVMAVQREERIRFVRPLEDWEALLRAGMLMNRPAELLVIRCEGEPVAYMGVQEPARDREGRLQPARVREIGGSRWAIASALAQEGGLPGAEVVEIVTHADDREWTALARLGGWTLEPVAFPGTLGILDPPAFFDRLAGYIAERLGRDSCLRIEASAEGARLQLGPESYEVAAPGPLAALVFGGETEEAQALPPLSGEIGRTLSKLFPMPLIWYGYNYV